MTKKDRELSAQMVGYLLNFCKFGDPNGAGLTAWLPVTRNQGKVLCLGEAETHMGKPGMLKMVRTMLTNKAVGE
jgi:carboxylesterase type B